MLFDHLEVPAGLVHGAEKRFDDLRGEELLSGANRCEQALRGVGQLFQLCEPEPAATALQRMDGPKERLHRDDVGGRSLEIEETLVRL